MESAATERSNRPPEEHQRRLTSGYCRCKHFGVVYTTALPVKEIWNGLDVRYLLDTIGSCCGEIAGPRSRSNALWPWPHLTDKAG